MMEPHDIIGYTIHGFPFSSTYLFGFAFASCCLSGERCLLILSGGQRTKGRGTKDTRQTTAAIRLEGMQRMELLCPVKANEASVLCMSCGQPPFAVPNFRPF